jgi:DNA-binding NtrC family response regulator
MGKILVIQPHRMLQQALVLALFPDHEVQAIESLPESSAVKDFDAVIVDAGSLVESGGAAAQGIRAVQSWTVPTVWVEGVQSAQPPKRDKLVAVRRPITRDALQSAVAECLELASTSKRNGPVTAQSQEDRMAGKAKAKEQMTGGISEPAEARVIELVDVVEAGPERGMKPTQGKKKK